MPSIDAVFQYYRERGWDRPAPTPTPEAPKTGLAKHLAAANAASVAGKVYNPYPAPPPFAQKTSGTFERRRVEADDLADSGIEKYCTDDLSGAKADLEKAKELGGSRYTPEQLDSMITRAEKLRIAAARKGINL